MMPTGGTFYLTQPIWDEVLIEELIEDKTIDKEINTEVRNYSTQTK